MDIVTQVSYEQLLRFLEEVDQDFPTPLSDKTNLSDYAHKLIENGALCAAVEEGRIIGLAAGYANDTDNQLAFLSLIGVVADRRGEGIGSTVLKAYAQECQKHGMAKLHSYVARDNESSIQVHTKVGGIEKTIESDPRPDDYHFFIDLD